MVFYTGSGAESTFNSSPKGSYQKERQDFDDGANALWSLYGKEAETHDEARIQILAADLDGIPTFVCILLCSSQTRTYSGILRQAGLFSAVLTSFLVQSIQNLQDNPMEKVAYFQQQSVAMLAQISQQIASSTPQVPIASTPPPYPVFRPSDSDIRVNIYWLVSLVCSLSAALLAILIQQWVRSYMQVFQQHDHPLKRARFRQFLFEGSKGMRKLAKQITRLIHISLFLFFLGLCDSMLNTNTTVGVMTIVPICLCGILYLYSITTRLKDLQSPYKALFSRSMLFLIHTCQKFVDDRQWRWPMTIGVLIQKLRGPFRDLQWRQPRAIEVLIQSYQRRFRNRKPRTAKNFEAYREEVVREEKERKNRDVRAVRMVGR